MPGDGVSLQTIISQLGSVAKAQARGQQSPQATAPFSERQDLQDELKVQRVKETAESEKGRIEPDGESRDKRKRRRQRRRLKDTAADGAAAAETQGLGPDDGEGEATAVGSLVDLRV
jgi:vacuolar-type H+-ATPase subunit I/STV1